MLVARKSDLEFQLQMINQRRMMLANIMTQVMNQFQMLQGGGAEPGNANVQMFEARLQQFQQLDKMLELMAQRIDIQHKAVQTEYESVKKVVDKNIEMSFGLMKDG
ncbi:MAG: hypothetical protein VKJ06_09130 [Vampirovibrionales bacterium]|nr:hypothetical protein [Vampirovibrionales bacterium]